MKESERRRLLALRTELADAIQERQSSVAELRRLADDYFTTAIEALDTKAANDDDTARLLGIAEDAERREREATDLASAAAESIAAYAQEVHYIVRLLELHDEVRVVLDAPDGLPSDPAARERLELAMVGASRLSDELYRLESARRDARLSNSTD